MAAMFYEGTLQSGIGQAIQQQKLVACFVRDDGATSKQWEDEWLRSGWLAGLLEQKAILLRLESGSAEAGFLAAFCKIGSAPTLVVIHNGTLQLQLGSEVGQEEFVNSVRRVLGAAPIPGAAAAQASTAQAEDDLYGEDGPAVAAAQANSPVPAPPPARAPPARVHTPATTAPTPNARGKQRAETAPQAGLAASPATTTSAQQAARAALQKKKREDAEELARVKARIEQDKAERKAQAEARKAERSAESQTSPPSRTTPSISTSISTSTRGAQSQTVSLNVRLFDGRTIRATFPRTATLETQVRTWVDAECARLSQDDPNTAHAALPPYFFRHILAPQPARELSAGDETQALGAIDLAPTATLVLVPVKGYSDAYAAPSTNLLAGTTTGLVSGAFGLLSTTVGYAGSVLGALLGGAGSPQTNTGHTLDARSASSASSASSAPQPPERDDGSIRVRTLADQRAREPRSQQFYNGNQSNIEPRPDDRG
ncbi:uncharacterized protein M421DRAFT_415004 [Didymella exigua CBS 183.55]|uniref:UBX domain-containing protein n=1 Tax=Didymella exigua CBS 183.55 TaxID=1150837 RepID=A0A6A5RZV7_9PLEO|nr:uncharacterized protein M421DRAFT_415004 [Didymella exigua CBS 183.55]KAF1933951.1 hypothetical protein M421DRAFT_415004 [Didymella exigua CBS 183.55]